MALSSQRKGRIAELHSEAFLLDFLEDLELGTPEPDSGVDFRGKYHLDAQRHVYMHFQVKSDKHYPVKRNTYERWTNLFESEPVFLLYVEMPSAFRQKFRYRIFREYILEDAVRHKKNLSRKDVRFRVADFTEILHKDRFREVLRKEAQRADKQSISPHSFHTALSAPIRECDLPLLLGKLHRIEPPAFRPEQLTELLTISPSGLTNEGLAHGLRELVLRRAELPDNSAELRTFRSWLSEIDEPVCNSAILAESRELGLFWRTLTDFERGRTFYLPGFSYREVGVWRIPMKVYPNSVRLLEHVFERPRRWSYRQLMASLLLLSDLAHSEHVGVAASACKLFQKLRRDFSALPPRNKYEYAFQRQCWYCVAEALGTRNDIDTFINFVYRNGRVLDPRLLRSYYRVKSNDVPILASKRKVAFPRPRDLGTPPISHFLLEHLHQDDRMS